MAVIKELAKYTSILNWVWDDGALDYSSDFTLKTFGFSKEMMWAVAIFLGMFFALQMESKMKKKAELGK